MRKMFSKNQIETIAQQVVQEQGGTKLYKHFLTDGAYELVLINQEKDEINFTQINTYVKFKAYLDDKGFIIFYHWDNYDILKWSHDDSCFYTIYLSDGSVDTALFDDWTLANTTDTVTEL